MTESNIQKLMEEARAMVKPEDVYNLVSAKVDAEKMLEAHKEKPLTLQEVGMTFAYIGFMEGVSFALQNIEAKEEA